jgi:L,D-transpeptidase YcbB
VLSLRTKRTGRSRPVRILFAAAAIAAAVLPLDVAAAAVETAATERVRGQTIEDFYRAGRGRLLWFDEGQQSAAAENLLALFRTASVDGLDPARYESSALRKALQRAWGGNKGAARKADLLLSKAFVDYVRDLRAPADTGIIYVDSELRPKPPSPRAILEAAARAPSLERYVRGMGWMHPIYGELRAAMTAGAYSPQQHDRIRANLERARELPGGRGRFVLVNAAAQRLDMYEDGKAVDSMRVVVGKPKYPTPMMAAFIRFASLNPYWYVPADLAAERIAPNVLRQGFSYLERQGYQVVSDFVDNPRIYDPSVIDWQAVADGRFRVLLRQLPGPQNSMGRIKFMFPNAVGVYLHDNPERELFEQAARLYSGGCVRLEDAWRLSRWLFGRDLSWEGAGTEEKVPLDKPVPVYITYLTTVPDGSTIAFLDDVYGLDAKRIVEMGSGQAMAASR